MIDSRTELRQEQERERQQEPEQELELERHLDVSFWNHDLW